MTASFLLGSFSRFWNVAVALVRLGNEAGFTSHAEVQWR